jgi:TrmH family RNA methyltransferase
VTITSTTNPRVKWVRELQQRRRARQREGLFVVEGLRLAREAAAAQVRPRFVLHTQEIDNPEQSLLESFRVSGAEVATVSAEVMAACSSLETPPGLLAVLPQLVLPIPEPLNLVLVAEGLADPGNLGSVLRTAVAAGVQLAVLAEGTVDPYNPKVVRGGMGAHFHLPLRGASVNKLLPELSGLPIWLADAHAGRPYFEVDWRQPATLALGGEAAGPSEALRQQAQGVVHIPMEPEAESLNAAVAAAVILFEIRRQRGVG